jgi:hypothetical protein
LNESKKEIFKVPSKFRGPTMLQKEENNNVNQHFSKKYKKNFKDNYL